MLVVVALLGFFAAALQQLIRLPFRLQQQQQKQDVKASLERAMNTMVNDLREADPTRFRFSDIYPTSTIVDTFTFNKRWMDLATPSEVSHSTYTYTITAGVLQRNENGALKALMSGLETPTASLPLIQLNPASPAMLILTLQTSTSTLTTPLKVERVVTLKS